MQRILSLVSLAIVAIWVNGARGDDAARPVDDAFLTKAAQCINTQIDIAKLAETRAQAPKVKEFAAQLVQDHQKGQEKAAKLLKERNLTVESGATREDRAEIERLSKLQGAQFDREFLTWVIDSHKKAIGMCENQAKNGKNAEARSFADEGVTGMREHQKRAEELLKNL
jgi:putative membrane protein